MPTLIEFTSKQRMSNNVEDVEFDCVNDKLNSIEQRMESLESTIKDIANLQNRSMNKTEDITEKIVKSNTTFMETYADKVKELNNVSNTIKEVIQESTQPELSKPNTIIDSIKEYNERENRKNNLVMYGLPESGHLPTQIKGICYELKVKGLEIIETKRLGNTSNQTTNKPRPLLIKFKTIEQKRELLSKAKHLRQSKVYKSIFISPDLTLQERNENKKLIDELRQRKANGETGLVIRRGEIIRRQVPAETTQRIII